MSLPSSSEYDCICLKGGKERWPPLVSGMIQWGLILPWTACHTWSTGSLCGPSVATCGAAACQGGRKPCHTLCTDKSSLNGNCVRASWPGIADHRTVELIQKGDLCGKTVSEILSKKKKGKKDSHLLWLQNKFIWTADILVTLSITGIAFAYFETALHFLKHSTFWGFSFKKILTRVHSEIQAPGKKYSVCNRSHRWGFKPVQHLTWIKSGKRFLQVGQVK